MEQQGMSIVPVVIAVAYFAILSIAVGIYARSKTKSATDFIKTSSGMGWVMVAFAFTLIPLGAGHTLSLWESAPMLGASVMWWGIITGGIFLPIMMLWLGPIVRRSGCNNLPEILEKVIDKRFGRLNAGLTIATWTGIGSAETLATAAAIFGLGGHRLAESPSAAFALCTLFALILIFLYVIFGGILQMAVLNFVNAIVMIAGSYLALGMLTVWLVANIGGWTEVVTIFESMGKVDMLASFNLDDPGLWFMVIIPVAVLHITAGAVAQNMNSPFFAAKSDADCRKGVFIGTFFNVMASGPWIVMALTAVAITTAPQFSHLLPELIGNADANKLNPIVLAMHALPAPILGLLMISLLCATLSTGGATVLANANVLTNEIFKKAICPTMSDAIRFKLLRISIIICVLLFALPAFLNAVIFPVFLWCFSFGIPVFVIYVMGLKVRRNTAAAWITIIVVYIVNFWWTFFPIPSWATGAWSLNMYPVTVLSIVLGILLPFIIPGGKPPFFAKGHDFAAGQSN